MEYVLEVEHQRNASTVTVTVQNNEDFLIAEDINSL